MEPAGFIMVCRASSAFAFWTDTVKARNTEISFVCIGPVQSKRLESFVIDRLNSGSMGRTLVK
jgi:hypothetical protein